MAVQSTWRRKFMVERCCQKNPTSMCFFCNAVEAEGTQKSHSCNCCWCCLTIWVLASPLYTFLQLKHPHSGIFLTASQAKSPPGRNEVPVRDASLTRKIPLCGSNSRNVAGAFAVPKCFIWNNSSHEFSLISVLHCPSPLSPSLQAGGSPGFDYGDRFIVLMAKSSYGNDLQ